MPTSPKPVSTDAPSDPITVADGASQALTGIAGLRFHHLGLAVRRPEKSQRFLERLGYTVGPVVHDPLQNTRLIMCHSPAGMPAVEIIFPADSPGPLDQILEGRNESIYHVCYEAHGVNAVVSEMREGGVRVTMVSPPKPAVLFGGRPVSFYMAPGFGLIEFIELDAECE